MKMVIEKKVSYHICMISTKNTKLEIETIEEIEKGDIEEIKSISHKIEVTKEKMLKLKFDDNK